MSDTNQDRKRAVREAWKNERGHVREGKGTRDWSQTEQREIVAKGRANGYEGHHMKSVKDYPQHAGNPQNIQFLNRSEHVNGAHKGDTKNSTNGYYNPKTGTMQSFGNRNPQAPPSQALSAPLTQRQQNIAVKREQVRQQAAKQAKTDAKPPATKNIHNSTPTQTSQASTNKGIENARSQAAKAQSSTSANAAQSTNNKGIEAARQKSSASQSGKSSSPSTNQGIKSYQSKTSGQSTSGGSSVAKGSGASGGKSGGSSSGGQSSGGSGQGR